MATTTLEQETITLDSLKKVRQAEALLDKARLQMLRTVGVEQNRSFSQSERVVYDAIYESRLLAFKAVEEVYKFRTPTQCQRCGDAVQEGLVPPLPDLPLCEDCAEEIDKK